MRLSFYKLIKCDDGPSLGEMANISLDIIPIEIISEILKYLSRPDRLSCSLVCRKWKEALNRKGLWMKLILKIDKDFLGYIPIK